MSTDRSADPARFEASYAGTPPWDIGRPQPALAALADAGLLHGQVLDVGCGTGEHALMAAARGLPALGVDGATTAIAIARRKAEQRRLPARFLVHDALDLGSLGERFDVVLDCGLFHVFDDAQRPRFAASLRAVTVPGSAYHLLCFSERQPGDVGPRRVTQGEIRECFAEGFRVESIEAAPLVVNAAQPVRGWLAHLTRT